MAKKKCLEWGFDLTDFPSNSKWKSFLKRNRCKRVGTKKLYGDYAEKVYGEKADHFLWRCNGVNFTTTHGAKATKKRPDLDGGLGYVGVEFSTKNKPKWDEMRNDFVESASFIKEETPCDAGFVSPPSIIRKRKPMR